MRILRPLPVAVLLASLLSACGTTGPSAAAIDNSTLGQAEFRTHQTTYGVVYLRPQDVTGVLDAKVNAPLKQQLLKTGPQAEVDPPNLPHVTVVHIHSADPSTPQKMLNALPKPPEPIRLTLKTFYTTEAAKGAVHPWWLDLGIVKSGQGFEDMMAFNTRATATMAPLRDGPLPRVTGPVYAKMAEPGRELVKTMGVSGVNVTQDDKEQPTQHAGLQHGPVHACAAVVDESARRTAQRRLAPRHRHHLPQSVHRRAGIRRQREARALPDQPGRRFGRRHVHWRKNGPLTPDAPGKLPLVAGLPGARGADVLRPRAHGRYGLAALTQPLNPQAAQYAAASLEQVLAQTLLETFRSSHARRLRPYLGGQ